MVCVFFFKQKTAYEMRISDWSSDVCSSDLLSPTATLIAHELVLKWFDGDLKEPRDAVVAEPEIGLGPLHSAFDGKGYCYTTMFFDSQIVKLSLDAANRAYQGDTATLDQIVKIGRAHI